jgi:hypothetical protein
MHEICCSFNKKSIALKHSLIRLECTSKENQIDKFEYQNKRWSTRFFRVYYSILEVFYLTSELFYLILELAYYSSVLNMNVQVLSEERQVSS